MDNSFIENRLISIVIPAYNESQNIKKISEMVSEKLKGLGELEIIFVDDGSTDSTLEEIKSVANENPAVKFISFSRNFGHQKALKAGIDHANGDCVITMDADLQHPPEMISHLIEQWQNGFDIVYTVRKDPPQTNFLKKATSRLFYKFINMVSDIDIPLGAADFRLLDRKVVDELKNFKENWLFIRGLVAWLGFKQTGIEYTAGPRYTGSSKYTLKRMISFAIEGLTSFSILPLRLSIIAGFIISFFALLYIIYALIAKFYLDTAIKGWTSILISVLLLGGIQLIFLGIIGEYLGKMFIETKNRPPYVIKEKNL